MVRNPYDTPEAEEAFQQECQQQEAEEQSEEELLSRASDLKQIMVKLRQEEAMVLSELKRRAENVASSSAPAVPAKTEADLSTEEHAVQDDAAEYGNENNRSVKNPEYYWTDEETMLLIKLRAQGKIFAEISQFFVGKSSRSCCAKYNRIINIPRWLAYLEVCKETQS